MFGVGADKQSIALKSKRNKYEYNDGVNDQFDIIFTNYGIKIDNVPTKLICAQYVQCIYMYPQSTMFMFHG